MHQRPPIQQHEDIGAWQSVLTAMDYTAVVTNACILGFTSGIFNEIEFPGDISSVRERYTKHELWAMVAVTEHVLLLVKSAIGSLYSGESDEQIQASQDHGQAEKTWTKKHGRTKKRRGTLS